MARRASQVNQRSAIQINESVTPTKAPTKRKMISTAPMIRRRKRRARDSPCRAGPRPPVCIVATVIPASDPGKVLGAPQPLGYCPDLSGLRIDLSGTDNNSVYS
jgi:hypothetical protein